MANDVQPLEDTFKMRDGLWLGWAIFSCYLSNSYIVLALKFFFFQLYYFPSTVLETGYFPITFVSYSINSPLRYRIGHGWQGDCRIYSLPEWTDNSIFPVSSLSSSSSSLFFFVCCWCQQPPLCLIPMSTLHFLAQVSMIPWTASVSCMVSVMTGKIAQSKEL